MDRLVAETRVCRRCRLWSGAKNSVPGEGNLDASLMLIGEAPGYREDIEGRPFVGAAGRLLDKLLASIALKRTDVYIGNVVKHRPPENRDPRPDEIMACVPYLDRQIQTISPKLIAPLGRHSTRYILSRVNTDFTVMTQTRGQIYEKAVLGVPVTIMPTFHPASALYNAKYRTFLEEDFQRIKTTLERFA
jgi:uracil-DNA glycosylase family 4